MATPSGMTKTEIAEEFIDLWTEWETGSEFQLMNEMLGKNVDYDLLTYFSKIGPTLLDHPKAANLLAIGYIIRLLEDRIA
ncbi:MAG: hypothetical protein V3U11_13430 [Planctomycetota bacterium]